VPEQFHVNLSLLTPGQLRTAWRLGLPGPGQAPRTAVSEGAGRA
jgi:hypothetical protein